MDERDLDIFFSSLCGEPAREDKSRSEATVVSKVPVSEEPAAAKPVTAVQAHATVTAERETEFQHEPVQDVYEEPAPDHDSGGESAGSLECHESACEEPVRSATPAPAPSLQAVPELSPEPKPPAPTAPTNVTNRANGSQPTLPDVDEPDEPLATTGVSDGTAASDPRHTTRPDETTTLTRKLREEKRLARLAEHRATTQAAARSTKFDVPRPDMSSGVAAEKKPATITPKPATWDATDPGMKPVRLRLDPQPEAEEAPAPSGRFRRLLYIFGSFHRFYHQCPNCQSPEVYGVNRSGDFMGHESERSLVYQRMHCERCIFAFGRPGRIFAAPTPKLRPKDTELYG